MENSTIREGLKTALLLSKVTNTPHDVEIDGVGIVKLSKNSASLLLPRGKWKKLSRHNLEDFLQELLKEPIQSRSRRRMKPLVFSAA